MADADHLREPNPWHPITVPIDLKHLGKLSEEAGELCAAISRCIIQGVDEREPVTGKQNAEWLEDEIADVMANMHLVVTHFQLDIVRILERKQKKEMHLRKWHGQLSDTHQAEGKCSGS
jgi:NTP pyrophosphatase (non-canonical NTP hydrolase)